MTPIPNPGFCAHLATAVVDKCTSLAKRAREENRTPDLPITKETRLSAVLTPAEPLI